MPDPYVFVVIPSFNNLSTTRVCLGSLSSQTYSRLVVILSDSGSTDGTYDVIHREFPSVHIVQGNSDWWWTKATNEGIKYALSIGAADDYVMTLNNDVVVPQDYLAEMVSLGERYPGSIIGSSIYDARDKNRLVECGSYIDWRTMKYCFLSISDFDSTGACEKLTFLCGKGVLYPALVFRECGLFDDIALPHYGADQDFVALCKKQGYLLRVQTRSRLYSREDMTAPDAKDVIGLIDKLKLLVIRKSKLNISVHMKLMLRHCPKRYWVTSATFLVCRLVGHIFVNKGAQHNLGKNKKRNISAHT